MSLNKPNSVKECLYFTNRSIGEGFATAWVYRGTCPKCNTPTVGKPIKKNGKVDKKAEVYECRTCKFQESNEETESKLKVEIQYKCPHCANESEATTEYKRRTFEGVQSYVFECDKCGKSIGITKKMKKSKKKK